MACGAPEVSILLAASEELKRETEAAAASLPAALQHVPGADLAIETALAQDFDLVLLDLDLAGIGATAAADILRRAGCLSLLVAVGGTSCPADFDASLARPVQADPLRELGAQARARRSVQPDTKSWIAENCDDLAQQFRRELPAVLEGVRAAAHDRDLAALRRILHRLKGSAGNFGHPEVSRACAGIEALFREGETDAALAESLALAGRTLNPAAL